jgi:hypothetical protein
MESKHHPWRQYQRQHQQNTENAGNKKSPDEARAELADHLAKLLTGQKIIAPAPEPEELNSQAQVERAWRELSRGHNWPKPKDRDELFRNPILRVVITRHVIGRDRNGEEIWARPGDVLIDRLREVAEMEGVKSVEVDWR